jgi:hypothetical protein
MLFLRLRDHPLAAQSWSKKATWIRPWYDTRNEIMFARINGAGVPSGPSISHFFSLEAVG